MIKRIVQWLCGRVSTPLPVVDTKPARLCFVCGNHVGSNGIAVCKSCLDKARHEPD